MTFATDWRRIGAAVWLRCCYYTSISVDRTWPAVYKYSFQCIQLCEPGSHAEPSNAEQPPRRRASAIAGATGFTGQELLRLLSRHPAVALTAAMSSGATASRKLPGLARLWTGEITPLSPDDAPRRRRRLPGAARRRRRRARARPGRRRRPRHRSVRRLPADGAGRACALVSRDPPGAGRESSTDSPNCPAAPSPARVWSRTPDAIRPPPCSRWRRWPAPASWLRAATSSSTRNRACRAPARRRPSERISPRSTAVWRAYGVFGHRHGAEIEQGIAAATARSAPDDLRAASRAARSRHPVDDLRAPGAGHDRRRRWRRSTSRPTRRRPSSGSSDRRCRKSSTSRTRTSATSAGASMHRAVPSSCR